MPDFIVKPRLDEPDLKQYVYTKIVDAKDENDNNVKIKSTHEFISKESLSRQREGIQAQMASLQAQLDKITAIETEIDKIDSDVIVKP